MKTLSLALVALMCTSGFAFDAAKAKQKKETGIKLPVSTWKIPAAMDEYGNLDVKKLPDSPYGKAVELGWKIATQTHNYIGPNAKDPKKRYAGNHLSCNACHAIGGVQKYEAGFVGITARFPQYNARADAIVTLADRINGCMQRSMNGKVLPYNSPEMRAMLTYMHYLSQGTPIGAKTEGQGLKAVKLIDRAADPKKGKVVYAENCAACHGENGEGMKNEEHANADYYIYPPVWGNDSYNTGAGMYRAIKAAQFIKHNMPQGNPTLTDEQAFDVAAYINTQPRPIKKYREADFPDRTVKAIDMDVPTYDDDFSVEQHRFGPFGPIKAASKAKK